MTHAPHSSDPPRAARRLFESTFGTAPTRGARAPGRVNLIGEHVDYNGGVVIPMAIDRDCIALGMPRADQRCVVVSDTHPEALTWTLNDPSPALPLNDWRRYPLGVLTLLAQRLGHAHPFSGLSIAIASSVPPGAGLSSSASLEVAIATLADHLWSEQLSSPRLEPLSLAQLCQRAEHDYAHVPCGLMDQLTSVVASARSALQIDCRENTWQPIAIPKDAAIVVCTSGVKHALASSAYRDRRESCEHARRVLGVESLRDVPEWMLRESQSLLDPETLRCARHVVTEIARAEAFAVALQSSELKLAGQLMLASHESLRRDYRVSCAELDALVDAAMHINGVFGSRLTGGGFGGSTVSLCRADAAPALIDRLQAVPQAPDSQAFTVQAAAGAAIFNPESGRELSANSVSSH